MTGVYILGQEKLQKETIKRQANQMEVGAAVGGQLKEGD